MKNEDWQLLKTLYATKNLTQAARLLFITQPALTKRLKYMEKTVGCQLVQRSNKGVSFTAEGEYLAKQANLFLDLMEETRQHLRSMGAQTNPVVRIGAPSSFAKYF
ncbi:MAG: LysR family transcriptional regulator, partial [Lawsonibacter sp.]